MPIEYWTNLVIRSLLCIEKLLMSKPKRKGMDLNTDVGIRTVLRLYTVQKKHYYKLKFYYPPMSEASREVANLTWKNPLTPVYGVKQFVCLSVCSEIWPQLSQDWRNRISWNFTQISPLINLKHWIINTN